MTESLGTRGAARTSGRWSGGRADGADELGLTVHDVARDLRRDVAAVELPLPLEGAAEAESSRRRLLAQLDEHLLPRLKELSSPAVVVLAGSTGAGKSTLYNSLLGDEVSQAGVLRPTTREPVLAFNPLDADVVVPGPVTELSRVVEHDGVPRGTALLDAPDLDSLLSENRSTAQQLLEAADLWLFVTTASRYGDALPWQALGRAKERGASVAMVLNRVPKEILTTVRADLLQRLKDHGLQDAPLFVVPDVGPHEGLLDPSVVLPVQRWLTLLAGPDRSRSVIVRTLRGSLAALPAWVTTVSDAVEAQGEAAHALRRTVRDAVPDVAAQARRAVEAGTVGGTAVAARWSELSGSDHVDRVRVRGGVVRSSRRRGRAREEALAALRAEVEAAARHALLAAGARADEALRDALTRDGGPAGGHAVAPDPAASAERRESAARSAVAAWGTAADDVAAHLAERTGDARRAEATLKAFGPGGTAALLLAAAAGTDDAERLLALVLGDDGAAQATALRADLADRAAQAVQDEADAVLAALDVPALADDAAAGLRLRLAELRRLA